jgi:predicted Holliday junction resolvase-like endonuclease
VNLIIVILICILIIVFLGVVIYFLLKNKKKLKKEISQLTSELYKSNQNAVRLAEYIEKVQKIESDEKTTNEKIKEAKTDEEIMDLITGIVSNNNSRVRQ